MTTQSLSVVVPSKICEDGELKTDERIMCENCGSLFRSEFRKVVHVDAKMNRIFACPVCNEDLP